jgi:hypothetical protein
MVALGVGLATAVEVEVEVRAVEMGASPWCLALASGPGFALTFLEKVFIAHVDLDMHSWSCII